VKTTAFRWAIAPAAFAVAVGLTACGGQAQTAGGSGTSGKGALSGEILLDGSSTVAPLSSAAGELFKQKNPGVNVSVQTSGTGGGFKKFCAGQTDISNASRPIKDAEKEQCKAAGIEFQEIVVANDALSIVVGKGNTFLQCLTKAELKTLWAKPATGTVTSWKQVNPSFPDAPIKLYGPGTDSGTFDYFTEAINGKAGDSRTDYSPSEDDNVIVKGVSGDVNALGYFGLSYLEENTGSLRAVKVDGGAGCVEPSIASAQDGTYMPLSRPLFIYVSKKAAAKPAVKAFVQFYVETDEAITKAAKFVPLNAEQKAKATAEVKALG